jgi:AraC-like DNA-binding protein
MSRPSKAKADSPRGAFSSVADGVVATGRVRVAPLMALVPLLRERDVDPVRVLARFGHDLAFFEEPENTMPFDVGMQLLAHCAEVSRCEHFGLLVGQRGGLSVLGPVGFLMQSAPDVRAALQALGRYLHVHDRGAVVGLAEEGSFASLSYTVMQPNVDGRSQVLDLAIAIGLNLMRALCGSNWLPTEVQLAHRAPADASPYRKFFGATIRFDSDRSALVFPLRWLERPNPSADPLLHRMMEQRIRQLHALSAEDLVSQMRRLLASWVTEPRLSLDRVAAEVGMSPRTLNRRLAVEGTSFASLRDEARRDVACGLLRDTQMPAAEIADLLCYADSAAFSRAFHRWTGQAPTIWRAAALAREHRAESRRRR